MIVLASETSTLLGSVALYENNLLLASKESPRQGSHSDKINVFIEEVLQKSNKKLSDVDLFAAGIGPGSFTGIRISINAIKTLAYCYEKPVVGINSLINLAWQCLTEDDKPIVAMINAYKNMLYIATYRKIENQIKVLREPEVIRVQNITAYLTEKSYVVGDGFPTYEKYFSDEIKALMLRSSAASDDPTASSLGSLALLGVAGRSHWSELQPVYLRASEAEENKLGIKFQAL